MRFMRMGVLWLAGLGVLLGAGCASLTGQPFSPVADLPQDGGVIYVYRPYNIVGGAKMYTILLDGVEVGKLVNGSYHALLVPAGPHRVDVKEDVLLIQGAAFDATVHLAGSEARYLRFGSSWAGGQAKLIPVEETTAMPELKECKKY